METSSSILNLFEQVSDDSQESISDNSHFNFFNFPHKIDSHSSNLKQDSSSKISELIKNVSDNSQESNLCDSQFHFSNFPHEIESSNLKQDSSSKISEIIKNVSDDFQKNNLSSSHFNFSNFFLESQSHSSDLKQNSPSKISKLTKENSDTQNSDDSNEIILSVHWKRGKLGAAYYNCLDAKITLLYDVADIHPTFINMKTLVIQVKPSQVVICGGLDDSFLKALSDALYDKTDLQENNDTEIDSNLLQKIFFMSAKKYNINYETCKRYIYGVKLGFQPEASNEEEHILFINSHIDLSQEVMVISFGMLIKYLEKYLPQINLNHDALQIMFISQMSLKNLVSIDRNTYRALQIFNPLPHPSPFNRANGVNREGLSIFAIFNRCKSKIGVKRLKEILLSPTKNLEEINERLDTIDFCCKPQHQHIVQNMLDCIKKVEVITAILNNIYRSRADIKIWRSLYTSLYNIILIGDICEKYSSQSKLFVKIAQSINKNIHEATHYINQVIDFEENKTKTHFIIRNGVDSSLDLLKQTYSQIPDILVKVAELELEYLPSFVSQCSIIYITELGYLLSIPIWKGNGTDIAEYSLPNFEVKFVVNNYVHYKTPRCMELDNVLGDSVASIYSVESTILITLIEFIQNKLKDIINVTKLVGELDCAIALSIVACENNYRRPVVTSERKLEIIQGRHILQEFCVDNFMPNDTYFGEDDKFIKIITGPNASGKSVYLKQVALIAYLAHIGSYVPAQSATIGLLDYIHSRIHTSENVSTKMSAFVLDLQQMSNSMYNSTPRTLIVIDEFGKGTTEIDGLSLLAASLIHFLEREKNCPYILVSTHFHDLPQYLPSSSLIHLQFMDYLIENEEIFYLHKIKDGVSGSSLTFLAAKLAGLSEETINRAVEITKGNAPLKCNPKLKITKTMKKEINYMKKIFLLDSEIENITSENKGNT